MALKDFKITLYPGQGTANGVDGDHVLVAPAYIVTREDVDYIHEFKPPRRSAASSRCFAKIRGGKEAVGTLMEGRLHWSLNNLTLSGIIFRVAATYRMLMKSESTTNATGPSFLGNNPEWAIDVIREVSKTTTFNAWCLELPVTIHLTDLPEAISEIEKIRDARSVEESEWLDAERESHALWHEYEELITELDIDHQTKRLSQLRRLITKGRKEIGRQEKQLDTEKEVLRRGAEHLQQVPTETFLFERRQVQFLTSQIKISEERHDFQKSLQDIRKDECDRLELRFKESEKSIAMLQALCLCQGVMDDNGHFKQPRKGSANSE
ncbi:hypothetical protein V496_01884 [Pseudogymnoascus sp. VKM F-4515 (FW-2607)]|nr:hypothetical protein V496_01884 [Pseudogymnoascus sp. VKM F-4515 (FW-2607)]